MALIYFNTPTYFVVPEFFSELKKDMVVVYMDVNPAVVRKILPKQKGLYKATGVAILLLTQKGLGMWVNDPEIYYLQDKEIYDILLAGKNTRTFEIEVSIMHGHL